VSGRSIRVLQVDAFTDRPFAGNPAGVVLEAAGLADGEMQAIATELNVADTAFLAPGDGARPALRWFTPSREVTYCGHATVATVHALVEAGRLSAGDQIAFDTKGGVLGAAVEAGAPGPTIWLEPGEVRIESFGGRLDEIAEAASLSPAIRGDWAPPALTADRDVLVAVRDLTALRGLAPDMAALARAASAAGIRGLCAVSRQTVEPGSSTHCRFFAPHYGIPEDPVTGSVHSSIGLWLLAAGLLPTGGAFTAEQGDGVGRPGRLRVAVESAPGRPPRARVGGRAVTVLDGHIALA
jgi:trans-2,3-dihydro-3-hydroxyanthranilate isomerase